MTRCPSSRYLAALLIASCVLMSCSEEAASDKNQVISVDDIPKADTTNASDTSSGGDDTADASSSGGDSTTLTCTSGNECPSFVCTGGLCAEPTCADSTQNGTETAPDCGGDACDPCTTGARCLINDDCASQSCVNRLCAAPLKTLGEECAVNAECASDRCEIFNGILFCTDSCSPEGTCDGSTSASCFRDLCVPNSYCEDPNGDGLGNGPGCAGTICPTCAPTATCSENPTDVFTCICNNGFSGDGFSCSDVNECNDALLHDCHPTWGSCNNTEGGFTCECLGGFSGDGKDCSDVNECDDATSPCGVHLCNNTSGTFYCACANGYTGTHPDCTDIDECLNPTLCGVGTCNNTEGAYTCSCPQGYGFSGGTCADINECQQNPNICGLQAVCTNTEGTFTCDCATGYRYQNTQCVDINECTEITDLCTPGACVNTPGTFTCDCPDGYALQDNACVDIDSCADPSLNNCAPDATCSDDIGSFTCTCNPGFAGDGTLCDDIDECSDPSLNNCAADGTCTNAPGSFSCACNPGYFGDGVTCTDLDECSDPAFNDCAADATCNNLPGGFSCTCNPGFTGDGTLCTDTDECADPSNNPCEIGTCTNTPGDYTCTCPATYNTTSAPGPRCLPSTCKALLDTESVTTSGPYELNPAGGNPFVAYCDMTTNGGGWTLVLKADGRTPDFGYNQALWTDASTLNTASLDLTTRDNAKFDAFSRVAFTEVLVGLEFPIQTSGALSLQTITLSMPAASLLEIIAGANDQTVTNTRSEWLALLPGASMQLNCNKGGFNVVASDPTRIAAHAKARIGFITNQEDDCISPDSRLGIGTAGAVCLTTDDTTAGNTAGCLESDPTNVDNPAFGVVFVR